MEITLRVVDRQKLHIQASHSDFDHPTLIYFSTLEDAKRFAGAAAALTAFPERSGFAGPRT